MDKSEALSILEQSKPSCSIRHSMASHAKERGRSYQKMVKLPLGRTIFLKVFAMGTKSAFGNDIYAYGSLKGITFERSQTLGTGGSKCDFHLYKTK